MMVCPIHTVSAGTLGRVLDTTTYHPAPGYLVVIRDEHLRAVGLVRARIQLAAHVPWRDIDLGEIASTRGGSISVCSSFQEGLDWTTYVPDTWT